MGPFKSILVDIDAAASAHPALERAVRLARASGASLTLTDVLPTAAAARPYLPPDVEEEIVQRRRQQLARVAGTVSGVRVDSRLLVGRPATVLIQEVIRSGHDLLMRSHARDEAASGPRPFGAIDMELLRHCPCPVMLVRHGSLAEHPQIAAAVNASTEHDAERALNVRIVELALTIAELEGGVPAIVQAWAPFLEAMVRSHSTGDVFATYTEAARGRAADDLNQFAKQFRDRSPGLHVELRRGEPEDVIPEFAVANGIDLVVMGTVARSGIRGLFIGNTAERVLRKLPCSVLAVKPEGFVSPVAPDGD